MIKRMLPLLGLLTVLTILLIWPNIPKTQTKAVEEPIYIEVEITGAVHIPGVYRVISGTNLGDLIQYALGTKATADLSQIENATLLLPNVRYTIPFKEESKDETKININKATLIELMSLPGIGQVTAQKIIDYRVKQGPFMRIEDIQEVSGIGAQTFEQIKAFITL
ncbi:ComEA family DNA-binding protein [Acholeplasma vituli]|uniref:ComEA family DNA-binding protein n=1 Tax=Paracholeplasma vituli TaxID=69473 RepID=A0ABT2Q076_9MOLU|nr:ComEA family DNA-binding protein [Paracholeplasma vituli]MCU0105392.1 ComEA family DNA-binding protein [Paracholeplasma vituli]